MLFSSIFCPANDPVAHYLILLCVKGTRAVANKQKASVKELVVDNSTNNLSSNINKISVFRKGKYYFQTQKIVKLNITTQIKKL